TYPPQVSPYSKFGDPPVTLYLSEDKSFYLDLYIWMESQTSIHQHSFEGAFLVLQGHSLESAYEFVRKKPIGPSYWGELKKISLEPLNAGNLRQIYPNSRLIHRVLHISKPTVSLVLRTNIPNENTEIQYNYDFGQLASNGHIPGDVVAKLRALSWYLRTGNTPTFEMVESLLPYAELWVTLSNHKQSAVILKKLSFLHCDLDLLEDMNKQKLFIAILNLLTIDEEKILFTAFEFNGSEWTSWMKKNYQMSPEDCQDKLKNALNAISWIDENAKKTTFLKDLFYPESASQPI
ncbi:MAG: hypothetical protein H0V66_12010, partial [Bdellovibrionales bacterium]|nr:hypothetical protein [Bdellovibrionales bacterium]